MKFARVGHAAYGTFCYNQSMGRTWARPIALAALAALVIVGATHERHAHVRTLHAGDRLIAFTVANLDGVRTTIMPHGRAQIINVFATWCGPCRSETPAFAAFADRAARRGIDVIGIDQQESGAQVSRFARLFDIQYPLFIDRDTITHDMLGARMIPTTIFVDASGLIRWEHAGPLDARDLAHLWAEAAIAS